MARQREPVASSDLASAGRVSGTGDRTDQLVHLGSPGGEHASLRRLGWPEFVEAPSRDPADHEGMPTTTPSGSSWRFAQSTAPVMRALAGRRGFPVWAVVHHRGRTTGRALAVPVAVMVTPDAFVIALPWGAGTNWVRNVLAAGTCVVRWNGSDHVVTAPVLLDAAAARQYYGRVTWGIIQRVIHAEAFLLLRRRGPGATTDATPTGRRARRAADRVSEDTVMTGGSTAESVLLTHLRSGALRWVRSSAHYEETVAFYRDLVGLPVVDGFASSYGEDGTIFGLPDYGVHMEVVRAHEADRRPDSFDQLVFYLPDPDAVAAATAVLRSHGHRPDEAAHPYWKANGALVFLDPDGRGVVYAPWVYGRMPDPATR